MITVTNNMQMFCFGVIGHKKGHTSRLGAAATGTQSSVRPLVGALRLTLCQGSLVADALLRIQSHKRVVQQVGPVEALLPPLAQQALQAVPKTWF